MTGPPGWAPIACAVGVLSSSRPRVGGFGGALEGGGELAVQGQDAFVGADEGQCAPFTVPTPPGDADRHGEQRCGGRDPGHLLNFGGDRLGEAFGRARGQFERRAPGDAVRDFFEGAGDAAVRDLDREQQRHPGGDAGDRHQLAQRLHAQVAAVEQGEGAQAADHRPLAEWVARLGLGLGLPRRSPPRSASVNLPSRISSTRSA